MFFACAPNVFRHVFILFPKIQVIIRHGILTGSIGTRPKEDISYRACQVLLPLVLVLFFFGSILEILFYLLFNYKVSINMYGCSCAAFLSLFQVHPWKDMMRKDKPNSPNTGISEEIEMVDIAITNTDTDQEEILEDVE